MKILAYGGSSTIMENVNSEEFPNLGFSVSIISSIKCRHKMSVYIFSPKTSRLALGPTHPPLHWVPGALYPEVKWPGREVDHSPPSSAEVRNARSYTSFHAGAACTGQLYLCVIGGTFCPHRGDEKCAVCVVGETCTGRLGRNEEDEWHYGNPVFRLPKTMACSSEIEAAEICCFISFSQLVSKHYRCHFDGQPGIKIMC